MHFLGAHLGGPGPPPGRPPLVGAAGARHRRHAKRGAIGVGSAPVPPRQLRALGLEYAGLEPGGTHDRLAPPESLRRLRTTLAGKVRATLRRTKAPARVARLAGGGLDLRPGGSVPVAQG